MMVRALIFVFLLLPFYLHGQLGFCEGSKGDPIFQENFGSGASPSSALPVSVTSYDFVQGDPNDGQYTITDEIGNNNSTWHSNLPASTSSNGKALIVNADYTAGQFYKTTVSGLCENSTYEFSAFLLNVYDPSSNTCEGTGIPVNVRFEIWDQEDKVLLKEASTGDINATVSPKWNKFGLTFRSGPGQGSIILKMFNNGDGGCGNDLGIDDITFSSCGDLTSIVSDEHTGSRQFCAADKPVQITLEARPDGSVYASHEFQWQGSNDGQTWKDLEGETSNRFTTPPLTTSAFYRVKVAETREKLQTNFCSSASESFSIEIAEEALAPVSDGDRIACSGEDWPGLSVEVEEDENVIWYDREVGGDMLARDTRIFYPQKEGTFYAEAYKINFKCSASKRTAVKFTVYPSPDVVDEEVFLCEENIALLNPGLFSGQYLWNTGATTQTIEIIEPGTYSVTITNQFGCTSTKAYEVSGVKQPVITEIFSSGNDLEVQLSEYENFEFSLDGNSYSSSSIFRDLQGGIYTVYVRNKLGCSPVTRSVAHIVVPDFISPNGDGHNDRFEIEGLSFYGSSIISIFDRYGNLISSGSGTDFFWTGSSGGKQWPSGDYWYEIQLAGQPKVFGHFSLLR